MESCVGIVRRTGMVCGCRVYGPGNLCGRHGGVSRNMARSMRSVRISEEEIRYLFSSLTVIPKTLSLDSICYYKCFICLDDDITIKKTGVILPCCNQNCCKGCLQSWCKSSNSCPHCRAVLDQFS